MHRLINLDSLDDVPKQYRGTPIERLVAYHNLGEPHPPVVTAEMLVGMCMDNRKVLRIPENFAFVLRAGGANLRPSEFKVSYAIAVGGVRAIAIVTHNRCGMSGLIDRRQQFIDGLVDAGWDVDAATRNFDSYAPMFEIGDEIDFALNEAKRLRLRYPNVIVAPFRYDVDDNRLYGVME
jgi:carbonic anhydrase